LCYLLFIWNPVCCLGSCDIVQQKLYCFSYAGSQWPESETGCNPCSHQSRALKIQEIEEGTQELQEEVRQSLEGSQES